MRLKDCKRGARVVIKNISADGALAARLQALGLERGGEAEVVGVSPFGRVFIVRTPFAVVALGAEIAEGVEAEG